MGNTSALILILWKQSVRNVLSKYPSRLMTSHILSDFREREPLINKYHECVSLLNCIILPNPLLAD